ncbi:MAG: hypothetical protein V3U67_06770, partial [Gemmatimonadota bacterium]
MRPENWDAWVTAGSSIGLTYNESTGAAEGADPGTFLNVLIQPWAYEDFMKNGEFSEGTMTLLVASSPVRKEEPALGGFYQGDDFR